MNIYCRNKAIVAKLITLRISTDFKFCFGICH